MNDFDSSMKKLSRKVDIPKDYYERIEEVLETLPEMEDGGKKATKRHSGLSIIVFIIIVMAVAGIGTIRSDANIIDTFKMTLMDIFDNDKYVIKGSDEKADGNDVDLMGVDTRTEDAAAKRDLLIELKETIVDTNSLYVLLQITAPSDIELNDDISFDYYAFCEGDNYNTDDLIGGAVSCTYLESTKDRPNVALYVMKLTGSVEECSGESICACMKDLTVNPDTKDSEVLVEGMWSVSFVAEKTVRESIEILGEDDVVYPYIDDTAKLSELLITPISMSITSDVSSIPYEKLGVSDTTISIRLVTVDGDEWMVSPYAESDRYIVESGESEFDQKDDISYQKDIYTFTGMIDINKISGVYIQDVFVPVN